MENFNETNTGRGSIELTPNGVGYFAEMRKWTLFLSIIGFIFIGLALVAVLFMGGLMKSFIPTSGLLVVVPMLIIAFVYFFPLYFLLKFSSVSKEAILTNDSIKLEEAVRYLKRFFKYIGIMTIVLLCLYLVAIVVAGVGASMFAEKGLEGFEGFENFENFQ